MSGLGLPMDCSLSVGRAANIAYYLTDKKFVIVHDPCRGDGCQGCQNVGVRPLTRKEAVAQWGRLLVEDIERHQTDRCACQHLRSRHSLPPRQGCVQYACPCFVRDDEP